MAKLVGNFYHWNVSLNQPFIILIHTVRDNEDLLYILMKCYECLAANNVKETYNLDYEKKETRTLMSSINHWIGIDFDSNLDQGAATPIRLEAHFVP